jgi:ABC-type multidrug transport system ATPase subunit
MEKFQPVTISTEGLSKRFNREWIFRNFSYEFKSGKRYAITGPNGSGKSTLLQILWGQVPPTAGTIKYTSPSQNIPVEQVYRHIAIATPYMDLIEDFTLQETLDFHFKLKPIRNNLTFDELLDILYLRESRDKFIRNFSSGMKQRLKLGLAMFTEASVIFLDEPGSHLDANAFEWYREQLNKLPEECLVFIGSNDQKEYVSFATTAIDLRNHKK